MSRTKETLSKLLTSFGVEDVESKLEILAKEGVTDENIDEIIKLAQLSAQEYSKPFVKEKLEEAFDDERKSLKKRYFQDSARKANKAFGSVLTNKEVDELMANNSEKPLEVVYEAIKEKALKDYGDGEEYKAMLTKANEGISERDSLIEQQKQTIEELKNQNAKDIEDFKNQYYTDDALKQSLIKSFKSQTDKDANILAEDFIAIHKGKSFIPTLSDGKLKLMDVNDPSKILKKSDTEPQTLDGMVSEFVDKRGLKPKSKGEEPTPTLQPVGDSGVGKSRPLHPAARLASGS